MLALPGKFRFEEERTKYETLLKKKEEEIKRLVEFNETLREQTLFLGTENSRLVSELRDNVEFTNRALKKLVSEEYT